MRFNPKETWKSFKILSGSEISHHKNTTIIKIQIIDGSTATTDTYNASVLGPHFAKNNYSDLPIDCYVVEEVRQI